MNNGNFISKYIFGRQRDENKTSLMSSSTNKPSYISFHKQNSINSINSISNLSNNYKNSVDNKHTKLINNQFSLSSQKKTDLKNLNSIFNEKLNTTKTQSVEFFSIKESKLRQLEKDNLLLKSKLKIKEKLLSESQNRIKELELENRMLKIELDANKINKITEKNELNKKTVIKINYFSSKSLNNQQIHKNTFNKYQIKGTSNSSKTVQNFGQAILINDNENKEIVDLINTNNKENIVELIDNQINNNDDNLDNEILSQYNHNYDINNPPEDLTYEQLLELQDKIGFVCRGFTEEEIEKIPKVKFLFNDIDNFCTICREDYVLNEPLSQLTCRHMFHPQCVSQWLLKEKNCPNCKEEVITEYN